MRVLQVFDSTIGWDQRVAIEQLLERLSGERVEQHLVCLGPRHAEAARIETCVDIVPRRFGLGFLTADPLRRLIQRKNIEVVHAWGVEATAAVLSACHAGFPAAGSIFDPSLADRHSKLLRVARHGNRTAVICATEIVRRRVVERGVARDRTVLVRPGLDFSTLNRARQSDLRLRLGLEPEAVVLLTSQPATREGGHFTAFWSTAVLSFLEPNVRLIVPDESGEGERIRRLARAVKMDGLLITPGLRFRFEELIAIADVFLMPGPEETSVTAAAWAMGAGVPIVASATRDVAELLAHDHNAFLIKPDVAKRLALRFADAIGRRRDWNRQTDRARAQAYEVFGMRRSVDQVYRVYENLLADRAPDDGIKDPAIME